MEYASLTDKQRAMLIKFGKIKELPKSICNKCGEEFGQKYHYMRTCFPCYRKTNNGARNYRCLDCDKFNTNLKTRCWDCYIICKLGTKDITNCLDCDKQLYKRGDKNDHYIVRCKDCHYKKIKPEIEEELIRYNIDSSLNNLVDK